MAEARFDESFGANPAENYEIFFVPVIGEPLAEDLVERMAIRSTDRVLDVACGTGIVARLAARSAAPPGKIAGLDPNAAMLAVARRTAPASAAIEWYEAPAERMPLPDASFDVIVCQMGVQFMADPRAGLAEMRRVLADGGRLWLSLPGPATGIFAVLATAMGRHIGPAAKGFVNKVFSLHDTAEIEQLLRGAGFRDVAVEATVRELELPPAPAFLRQYIHSTPLVGVLSQTPAEAQAAMEQEVLSAWRQYERNDILRHELRLVLATGVKAAGRHAQ